MKKVESLSSSKFEKFEMYKVTDSSKFFGGFAKPSFINLSDGQHLDTVNSYGSNFWSDGGVVGPLVP